MTVHDSLRELLGRYDGTLTVQSGSLCAWSAELRLTLTNPRGAPSRSVCFWSVGGADPEMAMAAVLEDAHKWLADSGQTPMSPEEMFS